MGEKTRLRISKQEQRILAEELRLVGVHCVTCKRTIEDELRKLGDTLDPHVDPNTGILRVLLSRPEAKRRLLEAVRSLGYDVRTETLTLRVRGAPRGWQEWAEDALLSLPGVVDAAAEYSGSVIRIEYDPERVTPDTVIDALSRYGVRAEPVTSNKETSLDIPLALLSGLALALLALSHVFSSLILAALAGILAWAVSLRTFGVGALRALRRGYLVTDLLLFLGTTSSLAASLLGALTGGPTYWEAPVLIVAFVMVGRWVEERARRRIQGLLSASLTLPVRARVIRDGRPVTVPESEVRPGDRVLVRPGEAVPVDGRVESGVAEVVESVVTGEPVPRTVRPGSLVYAGSAVASGSIVVTALRTGEYRLAARLARTSREAGLAKWGLTRVADRVVSVFVPVVLLVAAASFAVWLLASGSVYDALIRASAVLVVACPCALGIAIPSASAAAVRAAYRIRALLRRPGSLEDLSVARVLVLDKTGTVTLGEPRVVDALIIDRDVLPLVMGVAGESLHPASRAVNSYLEEAGVRPATPSWVQEEPGHGVYGEVEGLIVFLGRPRSAADRFPSAADEIYRVMRTGYTVVAVVGGRLAAAFKLDDRLRPHAARAVSEARRLGLQVVIATGDSRERALRVARMLGVPADRVYAELTPEEKASLIRRLQREGKVAYVGDGVNDLPAMAAADVGIAVESALAAAKTAGDIVVFRGGIATVPGLIRLARATRLAVRLNLLWAFAYNAVLIPVAAGALAWAGLTIGPGAAAAAMSASSLLTTLTSVALSRYNPGRKIHARV